MTDTWHTPYAQWFLGDHKGTAPPHEDDQQPVTGKTTRVFHDYEGVIRDLIEYRDDFVLYFMDADRWVTRNDQFAALWRLADDLTEAATELLAIGWPVRHDDGRIVWYYPPGYDPYEPWPDEPPPG